MSHCRSILRSGHEYVSTPVQIAAVLATLGLGLIGCSCPGVHKYQAIALTGVSEAPDPSVASFHSFISNPPSINNRSQVVFQGSMHWVSGGVAGKTALSTWRAAADGSLEQVLAVDNTQPQGVASGCRFAGPGGSPVLNDSGDIAFRAFLRQATGDVRSRNDEALWFTRDAGPPALLARQGSSGGPSSIDPPGTAPGTKYFRLRAPVFNNQGQSAFFATLRRGKGGTHGGNDAGLWGPTAEADLGLIARRGANEVPGAGDGTQFESFGQPVLNDGGQVAFTATLRVGSGDVTAMNDSGIWVTSLARQLKMVTLEGMTEVPGAAQGTRFDSFGAPAINTRGHVVFRARLRPDTGDVTDGNATGIWATRGQGELEVVVRAGQQASPRLDAVFSDFGDPVLNGRGQMAFTATLVPGQGVVDPDGSNDQVLWGPTHNGSLGLIARTGISQAPGTERGVVFAHFMGAPSINANGQVMFRAKLRAGIDSASVQSDNDEAIWLYDPASGRTVLVARKGDDFKAGPGDTRTIAGMYAHSAAGGEDGRQTSLNDRGQIALRLEFTDGSQGIILAEPSG